MENIHIVSYFALGLCLPSLSGLESLIISDKTISDLHISDRNNGWVGHCLCLRIGTCFSHSRHEG